MTALTLNLKLAATYFDVTFAHKPNRKSFFFFKTLKWTLDEVNKSYIVHYAR